MNDPWRIAITNSFVFFLIVAKFIALQWLEISQSSLFPYPGL